MECGAKGGTTATPLSDWNFADGKCEKWRRGWKLSARVRPPPWPPMSANRTGFFPTWVLVPPGYSVADTSLRVKRSEAELAQLTGWNDLGKSVWNPTIHLLSARSPPPIKGFFHGARSGTSVRDPLPHSGLDTCSRRNSPIFALPCFNRPTMPRWKTCVGACGPLPSRNTCARSASLAATIA